MLGFPFYQWSSILTHGGRIVLQSTKIPLKDVKVVTSYGNLVAQVRQDAGAWVEGANGEGNFRTNLDPVLTAAISQAGEVVSLLEGKRGVVLLQLWTSEDKGAGAVHNPMAVRAREKKHAGPKPYRLPSGFCRRRSSHGCVAGAGMTYLSPWARADHRTRDVFVTGFRVLGRRC